jgi:hypothetical protein
MDSAFPTWANVTEQLLVLRECNYSLGEAIEFGQQNFGFKPNGGVGGLAEDANKIKRSLSRSASRSRRRLSKQHSRSSIGSLLSISGLADGGELEDSEQREDLFSVVDVGRLSARAAAKMDDLELLVTQLRSENRRSVG